MRYLVALAIPVLTLAPFSSFSGGVADSQPATELSVGQARSDFDLLRQSIEEAHSGLYRFATKAETDKRFDAFRGRIVAPMSARAFRTFIAEVVADARDGHARLEFDSVTTASLPTMRLLPLRVTMEGDRLFIYSNDTPADSTIKPGMELLSVNGRSRESIVRTLWPLTPTDGSIETARRYRIARSLPQSYWLYLDSASTFVVRARNAAGGQVEATLNGVTAAERSTNSNPMNADAKRALAAHDAPLGNITLTFPKDPDIARIRIRGFDGATFRSQVDSVLQIVHARNSRALLLDLRGNGGGVDEYGAFLVSRFVSRPFRYFDRIHLTTIAPSFATWKPNTFEQLKAGTKPDPSGGFLVTSAGHSGVGEQAPAAQPYTGTLIVLMDGGSFSTTADVTATLHHMKRATFVGEETAGTYEGNTSGLNAMIVLQNSQLRLKIQMFAYYNALETPARGRGTMPDVPVQRTLAGMLNGHDAPLERAIALAAERIRGAP